jgi:hypothetical protein
MAIKDVVQLGFGAGGSIARIVMLGFGETLAPDNASLSGCVHLSATLQGRVEVMPTIAACARLQPTLTGNIEVSE